MVPDGWKIQKVSECLERVVDSVLPEPNSMYREIGIRSHAKGIFHKEPVTGNSLGNKRVFNVHPNCFVVNIVFAWEQAIAMTSDDEVGMIASHRFPMFKPKKNRCDIKYITYFFKTPRGKYLLELASPGGAGRNKTLGQNEFARVEIPLPPTDEQKKIARILSTWDRAIEVTEKLLNNSQQQKKALMQQLLTGKKRLPGFSGEWIQLKVGDILSVRNEKQIPSETTPLFSLTIENGITAKTERYNREFLVKNSDEKEYKIVKPSDIAYNPANLRWGAINYSRLTHDVVVSPIYEILYVKDITLNNLHFIAQVLMSHRQIAKFAAMVEGTLMERKAVKIQPFLATKISIPSELEEQQTIASVLSAADKEIEILEQKLGCLRQEKKALMQQLLTGKRRVKIDEEEVLVKEAVRA
ncbi:type I restriction enzyme, S subunit [Nitrosomonas nitrosa]|uniref:Type I restriction enzyme, S subunit n=1 Tax=Nitrosomonas nitrosa TaxID=52442 RepID=A0A1I4TIB7_9PROT|nr:restriction endonuclease subunit S [Nitrosomonas nitrosa]SFM76429.1 type I restriction enzyme, S subunit [Nitrosomonas nitrosa]